MRTIITEQDAKEAGIRKELLQDFQDVMQACWTAAIYNFRRLGNVDLLPKNEENLIKIGSRFVIESNFVNDSYIETRLIDNGKDIVCVRYGGSVNVTTVAKCIFMPIVDEYKNM